MLVREKVIKLFVSLGQSQSDHCKTLWEPSFNCLLFLVMLQLLFKHKVRLFYSFFKDTFSVRPKKCDVLARYPHHSKVPQRIKRTRLGASSPAWGGGALECPGQTLTSLQSWEMWDSYPATLSWEEAGQETQRKELKSVTPRSVAGSWWPAFQPDNISPP